MNLDDTLTLEQLSVSFSTDDGILPAVHAVSLSLPPAGITCLVGESGCGKSLTARAILHLLPENAHISGRILFRGRDLMTAFAVSGCIGLALLVAMAISSAVGTLIPLFFKKINIDPAVASGPLITTVNDLVAVVTYYGLSWLLLLQIMHLAG